MSTVLLVMALMAAFVLAAVGIAIRSRQLHRWLPGHVRHVTRRRPRTDGVTTIVVCVADHYEPGWGRPGIERERERVMEWTRRWPELAARHRDARGRQPQHTFFYPQEEYREEHLDRLAEICRTGCGDVEVHLHHDRDTSADLRVKLETFARTLHERHGLLRMGASGRPEYAFIHGNWALDNSAPSGRNCGVNDELRVLRETGCYADFTFPSAPDGSQPPIINSIYYATDDPSQPASHFRGVPVEAGRPPSGDLMLVQGPLTLNWRSRKFGLMPRIENGELSGDAPPTPERIDLWVQQHVHVVGRPDYVFIKLHTHGAQEKNFEANLGAPRREMHEYLDRVYNDGRRYRLLYASAREMYDLIKAAESQTLPRS